MSRVLSIHQPNYLPWLGYFHKMTYSDVFVFQDDVQYTPKTYINRCHIAFNGSQTRLSIPVSAKKWDVKINEVEIDIDRFAAKHLESFRHAYGKCQAYNEILAFLKPHFGAGKTNLADFNMSIIQSISNYLGLDLQFVKSSELGLNSQKNKLLIDISNMCEADIFVSGTGAKGYIEGSESMYGGGDISLAYQNFIHPEYRQRKAPFIPGCSILDLLFNQGDNAYEVLVSQEEQPFQIWDQEHRNCSTEPAILSA